MVATLQSDRRVSDTRSELVQQDLSVVEEFSNATTYDEGIGDFPPKIPGSNTLSRVKEPRHFNFEVPGLRITMDYIEAGSGSQGEVVDFNLSYSPKDIGLTSSLRWAMGSEGCNLGIHDISVLPETSHIALGRCVSILLKDESAPTGTRAHLFVSLDTGKLVARPEDKQGAGNMAKRIVLSLLQEDKKVHNKNSGSWV